MFSEELEYFVSNQNDLVSKYGGKCLIIKGKEVIGVYPDAFKAYLAAQEKYEIGSFMIQPCEPGPDAYTVTIASAHLVNF